MMRGCAMVIATVVALLGQPTGYAEARRVIPPRHYIVPARHHAVSSRHYIAPARRHTVPRRCRLLLPRDTFPTHMTQWVSTRTDANVGAVASGLQQAHYQWGYVLVTPDVYPTRAAARRRYQLASQMLHGDKRVRIPPIGQQMAVWVTGDQLTHYTVTTILIQAGATVAEINVGAGGPVVNVAAAMARAVSVHACG